MKRILYLAMIAIFAVSCVVDENDGERARENKLQNLGQFIYTNACSHSVYALQTVMNVNDFITASDEERKDSKYDGYGYYPATDSYKTDDNTTIKTNGRLLTDEGASWEISSFYTNTLVITNIGNGTYSVSLSENGKDSYPYLKNLNFVFEAKLTERNLYGLCSWDCTVEGTLDKGEDSYATFTNSSEVISYSWQTRMQAGNYQQSIQNVMQSKGYFDIDFYAGGVKRHYLKYDLDGSGIKDSHFGKY